MEDAASFGRLIDALRPCLGHLVIAGGWAHRLHRLHPLAYTLGHEPVRTRDVDFAVSLRAPLPGGIREALGAAGFTRTFVGEDAPPVTHYNLDDDAGFMRSSWCRWREARSGGTGNAAPPCRWRGSLHRNSGISICC